MREYTEQELSEKIITRVVCNSCGREIPLEREGIWTDYFHGEKTWGYFSEKDGTKESFDLCQGCYEKIIGGFLVKV